jgi:hypothetical protein
LRAEVRPTHGAPGGGLLNAGSLACQAGQHAALDLSRVRRQRLWDQFGDLRYGGFLAHRNPKENEDKSEILRPLPPVCRPKSWSAVFAAPRASTIPPTARFAASRKSSTQRKILKILESMGQRRLLSRSPFLRHLPFRKHALSPGWALKFPSICGLFARNLDGARAEWSGGRSLFLSESGDTLQSLRVGRFFQQGLTR